MRINLCIINIYIYYIYNYFEKINRLQFNRTGRYNEFNINYYYLLFLHPVGICYFSCPIHGGKVLQCAIISVQNHILMVFLEY